MNGRTENESSLSTPVKVLLLVLPCIGVLLFILRNYVLVPYSDPANWIALGRAVGSGQEPFRFPIGYPLYLWLALKITGPLYIFFANIPWVLAMIALTGVLTHRISRAAGNTEQAWLIAFLAMCFLAASGMGLWLSLANPYRDAPAHVFLLGSLTLLIAPPHAQRSSSVLLRHLVAGLLIGLAFCIREPAALVVPLAALYLWNEGRRTETSHLFMLLPFLAGAAVGGSPLILQSYLHYGQMAPSPYMLYEGRATPGFVWHIPHAFRTAWTAGKEMAGLLYGLFFPCLFAGIFFALFERRSRPLILLLTLMLLYFGLYSFYWNYFARYYFVVVLLAAPVAAYGTVNLLNMVSDQLSKPHVSPLTVKALIVLLGVVMLIPSLRSHGGRHEFFRLEQARRFQTALAEHVPEKALIIAPHRLAEFIRTLTPHPAQPPEFFWGPAPDERTDMTERLRALKDRYGAVYWMEPERHTLDTKWRDSVADCAGFAPVARWPVTDFRLHRQFGWPDILLYRVVFHRRTFSVPLPDDAVLARVALPPAEDSRPSHHVRVIKGDYEREMDRPGTFLLYVPPRQYRAYETITLKSAEPYSVNWGPELLPAYEPVFYSFEASGHPFVAWQFEQYPAPTFKDKDKGLVLPRKATLRLCTPWPDSPAALLSQWEFAHRQEPPEEIHVQSGAGRTSMKWPRNAERVTVVHPLDHTGTSKAQPIAVSRSDAADESEIMLQSLILHPVPERNWSVEIGSRYDAPFIIDGFYASERDRQRMRRYRWSGPRAEFAIYPGEHIQERILEVHLLAMRHGDAPPANIQLSLNGESLTAHTEKLATDFGNILRVEVPADVWRPGKNVLSLSCTPWSPSELLGVGDPRLLGVAVTALHLE